MVQVMLYSNGAIVQTTGGTGNGLQLKLTVLPKWKSNRELKLHLKELIIRLEILSQRLVVIMMQL